MIPKKMLAMIAPHDAQLLRARGAEEFFVSSVKQSLAADKKNKFADPDPARRLRHAVNGALMIALQAPPRLKFSDDCLRDPDTGRHHVSLVEQFDGDVEYVKAIKAAAAAQGRVVSDNAKYFPQHARPGVFGDPLAFREDHEGGLNAIGEDTGLTIYDRVGDCIVDNTDKVKPHDWSAPKPISKESFAEHAVSVINEHKMKPGVPRKEVESAIREKLHN